MSYTPKSPCTLSCGCREWVVNPPAVGGDWLCWEHGAVTRVSTSHILWHLRCKNCRYGRHNLGALSARTLATKHHIQRRHQVRVWCVNGTKTTTEWSTDDNQLSFDDIPPF